VISGYIDTANQGYGDHDIKMTIYYSDKTTVEDGKVSLVPPSAVQAPEIEEPKASTGLALSPTAILIIVIVILVLIDINWLVLKNRPSAGKSQAPVKGRKNK
jgi:hypothetical protein